jgi:hypothetical protein
MGDAGPEEKGDCGSFARLAGSVGPKSDYWDTREDLSSHHPLLKARLSASPNR